MRQYLNIFLVTFFTFSMIGVFGQEYDDLYFTKADRKKQKKKKVEMANPSYETTYEEPSYEPEANAVEATSFLGRQFQETNPTMDVSEESLDYYAPDKTQEDYLTEQTQSAYINDTERNPNYSNPQTAYQDPNNNQPVIINNYYNDNWNNWNRPRWNFGFGFNNWGGSFWSVSYGNAWGNPWYDPFWDPWWGWNAWGPRWGWNAGWGWNSWAWNGWGWRGGFYDPYWTPYYRRPVYIVDNNSRRGRDVVRGSRATRGSVSSRESRSSSGRGAAVVSDAGKSYSRQQADYLNRSRSSRYNSGTSRGSSTINSRTSNSNSSLLNNNSRSNTNSNYTRPNNTRTRSYSPPASSGSRSSSVRSSSSSRSSGSVSRSRSSSSSRSSGSRSSSGRSSSRRGGN